MKILFVFVYLSLFSLNIYAGKHGEKPKKKHPHTTIPKDKGGAGAAKDATLEEDEILDDTLTDLTKTKLLHPKDAMDASSDFKAHIDSLIKDLNTKFLSKNLRSYFKGLTKEQLDRSKRFADPSLDGAEKEAYNTEYVSYMEVVVKTINEMMQWARAEFASTPIYAGLLTKISLYKIGAIEASGYAAHAEKYWQELYSDDSDRISKKAAPRKTRALDAIESALDPVFGHLAHKNPNFIFNSISGIKVLDSHLLVFLTDILPSMSEELQKFISTTFKGSHFFSHRTTFALHFSIMNPDIFGDHYEAIKSRIEAGESLEALIFEYFKPGELPHNILLNPIFHIFTGSAPLRLMLDIKTFGRFYPILFSPREFAALKEKKHVYGNHLYLVEASTESEIGSIFFASGAAAGAIARMMLYASAQKIINLTPEELDDWIKLNAENPVRKSEWIWNTVVHEITGEENSVLKERLGAKSRAIAAADLAYKSLWVEETNPSAAVEKHKKKHKKKSSTLTSTSSPLPDSKGVSEEPLTTTDTAAIALIRPQHNPDTEAVLAAPDIEAVVAAPDAEVAFVATASDTEAVVAAPDIEAGPVVAAPDAEVAFVATAADTEAVVAAPDIEANPVVAAPDAEVAIPAPSSTVNAPVTVSTPKRTLNSEAQVFVSAYQEQAEEDHAFEEGDHDFEGEDTTTFYGEGAAIGQEEIGTHFPGVPLPPPGVYMMPPYMVHTPFGPQMTPPYAVSVTMTPVAPFMPPQGMPYPYPRPLGFFHHY